MENPLSGLAPFFFYVSLGLALLATITLIAAVYNSRRGGGSNFGTPLTLFGFSVLSMLAPKIYDATWRIAHVLFNMPGEETGTTGGASDGTASPTVETTPAPTSAPVQADPVQVPWELILAIAVVAAVLVAGILVIWRYGPRARAGAADGLARRENLKENQAKLEQLWTAALSRHDELDAQWSALDSDLESILRTPLLRDLSDPAVAAALRAMRRARSLRSDKAPRLLAGDPVIDENGYIEAVAEYGRTFEAAIQKSEAHGLDSFDSDERDKIVRAQRLLSTALDAGASDAERETAYREVVKIVQSLRKLSVPREAFESAAIAAGTSHAGLIVGPASVFAGARR